MAISKYKTKSGEIRYQASYWSGSLFIESKSFTRKIDAQEYLRKLQARHTDQRVGRLNGREMTYNNFFDEVYLKRVTVSAGTAQGYIGIHRKFVKEGIGKKKLIHLEDNDWSEFISKLNQHKISPARINRIHSAISAVYSMAVDLRYAYNNPLRSIGWLREPLTKLDFWSREEIQKFLEYSIRNGVRLAVLYQMSFETGMRIGEILGLKRDCIDLVNDAITICRTYNTKTRTIEPTTKSGHERVIGLNPGLKNALIQLMSSHKSEFVFCNKRGGNLKHEYVNRTFQRNQKSAEVRKLDLHSLRHTFASHFVMNGGSIYDLKALLGHASVETTMRYAHLAKSHLKAKSSLVRFEMPVSGNVVAMERTDTDEPPKYFTNIPAGQVEKK